MSLIIEDWRLKLLAIGLAVLMLGAVAFSQNPPTAKDLAQVPIGYTISPDLIVINPPTKTTVRVTGLADALTTVNANSVAASFDLSKASPGANVRVNLTVRPLLANIQVQNPVVPYVLNIDRRTTVSIPVQVRIQRVASGWQVTKQEARCPAAPCSVTFDGPSTWETNLAAFADFTIPVQSDTYDYPTESVLLVQNGQPLDLTVQTTPQVSIDPLTVTVHIEAKPGTTSRQAVLIDSAPSHGPPPGYRITNVSVDPVTVLISGAPDAIARIPTIALPAVDLSSSTSSATFKLPINYPAGVTGTVTAASVTYQISQNPAVSPSP